jgi:hypothetical protein
MSAISSLKKLLSSTPSPSAPAQPLPLRAIRIRLEPLHAAAIELRDPQGAGFPAQVANISSTGLAILAAPGIDWVQPGSALPARLTLAGQPFEVQLETVWRKAQTVGFRFQEPSLSAMRSAIPRYFAAELAAGRTHAVPPSVLKAQPDGDPALIMGDNGCELFLVMREGRLVRFTLTFFGNYVEGGDGGETRYGTVAENERAGPRYRGTDLIQWGKADPEVVQNMRRFVLGVSQLTDAQREALLAALS